MRESLLLFVNRGMDIEGLIVKEYKNIERFTMFNFIESYKNLYNTI